MKNIMKFSQGLTLLILLGLAFAGCKKDPDPTPVIPPVVTLKSAIINASAAVQNDSLKSSIEFVKGFMKGSLVSGPLNASFAFNGVSSEKKIDVFDIINFDSLVRARPTAYTVIAGDEDYLFTRLVKYSPRPLGFLVITLRNSANVKTGVLFIKYAQNNPDKTDPWASGFLPLVGLEYAWNPARAGRIASNVGSVTSVSGAELEVLLLKNGASKLPDGSWKIGN